MQQYAVMVLFSLVGKLPTFHRKDLSQSSVHLKKKITSASVRLVVTNKATRCGNTEH